MIQILGLRPWVRSKDKKTLLRTTFFNREWRAESVEQILQNYEALLEKIPYQEQYNLFFTVASCHAEIERGLKEQWVIPFDIDGLALADDADHATIRTEAMRVYHAACEALQVNPLEVGALFSGHGVQIFVPITKPILDAEYFDTYRPHYKQVADMILAKLREKGLAGTTDTSVFSDARLMRMPGTYNRKEGKVERKSFVLNSTMLNQGFDLVTLSGLTVTESGTEPVLRRYPAPDTKAVCEGCAFLKNCKENPSHVTEPQWYAMLSITTRLEDGENLSHAYSEGHPGYSHYETEVKIKQAQAASGPRTCKNIETLWTGCGTCENFGRVLSPITIKGPDYIKTKDQGFREIVLDKEGNPKTGRPAYEDLIKYLDQEMGFKVLPDTRQVFTYNGTHWQEMLELELKAWMRGLVVPTPSASEMSELHARVLAAGGNQSRLDSLYAKREGKANFKNGTLDYMNGGELRPHSAEDGFTSVLPYNYDPLAKCARFELFLKEIFIYADVIQVVKEYLGYCISGDPCWLQKSLMLIGKGANGKSVLLETMAEVVGRDNVSAVAIQDLGNPIARSALVNKLFNYSEETAYRSLTDSSLFKSLVTGGMMTVKKLYQQPYEVPNKAKFIMSANEFPLIYDRSDGLFRRLVLVQMQRSFKGGADNKFLRTELRQELPGIFNLLINEYRELKKRTHLSESLHIENAVREARDGSDPVLIFFEEVVQFTDPEHPDAEKNSTPKSDLYATYRLWAINNGHNPANNIVFFRAAYERIAGLEARLVRLREGTSRVRIFKGTQIKTTY